MDVLQTICSYITVPFVTCLVSVYLLHSYINSKRHLLPPGPTGLPIVGYIPFLPTTYGQKLTSLFNEYGSVFTLRLGSTDVVFLSDWELIKQSFVKDVFNNRPSFSFFSSILPSSLADWNGEEWKEQRKFSLRIFKHLGIGKQVIEERMLEEINILMRMIEEEGEKPIHAMRLLGSSVSNIVNLMITGERLDFNHPTKVMLDDVFLVREDMPSILGVLNYMPIVSRIFKLLPFTPIGQMNQKMKRVFGYFKQRMAHIESTLEYEKDDVNCFIEAYLKEMKGKKSGNYFDEKHLIGCAFTFFAAGSQTTGDFIVWFLLYMIVYPDVQEKLRQEVDDVIGESSRITGQHKQSMPYTEAVMQELHRHVSAAPIGLIHSTADDATLGQYLLPKGTHVVLCNFRVHENPEFFPDPEKFDPMRFMSSDGKFIRDEHVIPFGYGRRSCPGEPIANIEVFLYIVAFLQSFIIEAPEGRMYTTDGVMEFIGRNPKDAPIEVVFRKRKNHTIPFREKLI